MLVAIRGITRQIPALTCDCGKLARRELGCTEIAFGQLHPTESQLSNLAGLCPPAFANQYAGAISWQRHPDRDQIATWRDHVAAIDALADVDHRGFGRAIQ